MAQDKNIQREPDSVYVLKLILFFILGSIWVSFPEEGQEIAKTIPVGLIAGFIFAAHEHFQIDRKVEYAVLLISAALSYILPIGLVLLV